jgi:hypothetical protein
MCSAWRQQQLWLLWEPEGLLESSVQEYCQKGTGYSYRGKNQTSANPQCMNACAATYTHAESGNLLIKFQTHR